MYSLKLTANHGKLNTNSELFEGVMGCSFEIYWKNEQTKTEEQKPAYMNASTMSQGFSLRKVSQCLSSMPPSTRVLSCLTAYTLSPPPNQPEPGCKGFQWRKQKYACHFLCKKMKKHFLVSDRLSLQSLVSHKKWVYDVSASLLKYLWPNSLLSVCCVFPCFNPQQISMFFHVLKKRVLRHSFNKYS